MCLRELIFAGQADARVQEANLTGCAKADTVVFMQKGGLNFLYPEPTVAAAAPGHQPPVAVAFHCFD